MEKYVMLGDMDVKGQRSETARRLKLELCIGHNYV